MSYAGISTAILYVENGNRRKIIPIYYSFFFFNTGFKVLLVFYFQQSYIAIPQYFSKIQTLTQFGYIL